MLHLGWHVLLIGSDIVTIAIAVAGPIPNLEIILKARGIENHVIAMTSSFLGLAVNAGRICGGWLLDRIWVPLAGGVEFDLLAYSSSRHFGTAHCSAVYGSLPAFLAPEAGTAPHFFSGARSFLLLGRCRFPASTKSPHPGNNSPPAAARTA